MIILCWWRGEGVPVPVVAGASCVHMCRQWLCMFGCPDDNGQLDCIMTVIISWCY